MEDSVVLDEYGKKVPGCFRPCKPHCPYTAVIPSIVLDTKEGLRDIADCLVHVTSVNTTYYIDDKHRIMTVWAGPVEVDDYDYEENPLGLRSQYVIDRESGRMVYYNAVGDYSVMPLVEPEEQVDKTYVDEQDAATLQAAKDYTDEHGGSETEVFFVTVTNIDDTNHTFTADKTYAEAYEAYESGKLLVLKYVPIGVDDGEYAYIPLDRYMDFDEATGFRFESSYTSGADNRISMSYNTFFLSRYSNLNTYYHGYGGVEIDSSLDQYSNHAVTNSAVATALQAKADSSSMPVITMQSSDPGEGAPLAANNFIAVYLDGGGE